jgi:hypothetical protein
MPNVPAASLIMDGSSVTENSMSGPVHPDVASLSSGSNPPRTVPIFVTRYGEKYHYTRECSGLRMAAVAGIKSKSLCKTCDAQRKRYKLAYLFGDGVR